MNKNEATTKDKIFDIAIIGGGPSALTAGIYASRENLKTVLIERAVVGGFAATTDFIENYPGFPDGITGLELAQKFQAQAERFGAKIEYSNVQFIDTDQPYKIIKTDSSQIEAGAILIATGTRHRHLDIEGEKEYLNRGVHYCATCDGPFYKDKKIVVVGGGNSAAQEALFLSRFASQIDILVRSSWSACDMLVKKIEADPKINVHSNIVLDKIVGDEQGVNQVIGHNNKNNQPFKLQCDGVFVFVGLIPNSSIFESTKIELDEFGFIKTDDKFMTNIPGVFAAGDVRRGATRQIACAVGEGATVAINIREYLED